MRCMRVTRRPRSHRRHVPYTYTGLRTHPCSAPAVYTRPAHLELESTDVSDGENPRSKCRFTLRGLYTTSRNSTPTAGAPAGRPMAPTARDSDTPQDVRGTDAGVRDRGAVPKRTLARPQLGIAFREQLTDCTARCRPGLIAMNRERDRPLQVYRKRDAPSRPQLTALVRSVH
ncbi:hypothetical protein BD311DRAFT_489981 [Dichomitus squalens]|uniref:Uncharacterized protein n=1 Tax=Dichomitus squalens TaxID=114155 RepID=A0A4Q9MEQ7_9APHY|nr:hypothetical protein BD311DRAFT_489981 [Dichomitus squalens]